jgi:PAS domain S-box-containing protein
MANSETHSDAAARRYAVLARILESFTTTLDLDELPVRIANTALEESGADRAWLLHPVNLTADTAGVVYEATRPGWEGAYRRGERLPLGGSRELIRRALSTGRPVVSHLRDGEVDGALWNRFHVRSQALQIVQTDDGEPWAFGLHQCSYEREWTDGEIELFGEIGRYAKIALNNALLHRRAVAEAATIGAIIDQIPEAVAIYALDGTLRRINSAAQRMSFVFDTAAADAAAIPSNGLECEIRNPGTGEERTIRIKASPVVDQENTVLGSVVIATDVTEERRQVGRDETRRLRAECLASLSFDLFSSGTAPVDLNRPAWIVAQTLDSNVAFYLYDDATDSLCLAGSRFTGDSGERFQRFIAEHPYRSGEGLPGTVFQIGQPLLFSEVRGEAVTEFAREPLEKAIKAELNERSLIARPIESYGERLGAMVISTSDPNVSFDAEDLEFVEAVADRIGAAVRIHRLTHIAREGHRAAEELAMREVEARSRLEGVLDSAPVGIAVISAGDLRFESANPPWIEYAARFGRIAADSRLVGLHVAEVVPGMERALRQVAESGQTQVEEALEIGHNSETWYAKQIIAPVRGRYSGIQSLTVLVQDVTEQVRANREIEALALIMEERSARLASILGSMTDALLVYDTSGHVIDVNPSALSMFGLGSRSEAVTRGSLVDFNLRYPDGRLIAPEDLPYKRALRGEIVPDYLAVARHLITGQDLDLSIAAAPIVSNTVVGAVLVIRDITGLQELDRKKDEFLSVASHELRTPLTTIRGYTQLLIHSFDGLRREEQLTYLRAVLSEIDRMMSLITELLDVSRIESKRFQIEPHDIGWIDFLSRRVQAFRVQHPDRHIEFDSSEQEAIVRADADRMRQVIDNLLSNAMKYSPEGSPVEVHVEVSPTTIATSIVDHGIGIPDDEIPLLFERFHRARNVSSRYYGGLGLGLYIAGAIMEVHGGGITVQSVEGLGSEFTISLPRR